MASITKDEKIESKTSCSYMPDAAIIAMSCILLFVGLGTRTLWLSEGRWAEITREMFLTSDYFHPTIGGEAYFDKPLLTYWLVAGVSKLTHRLDEWTARVPSAISGLITIIATMWLGRRLWSAQIGRVAGVILLTCQGFLFWSRTADADVENLAAIMLAVSWYWACRERPSFASFLVFYLIIFIGALTKGLPAVVVPILAILPDIIIQRRWRQVLTFGHVLAAGIGLVLYIAPFWYAARTNSSTFHDNGLALVFRENIVRFFHPFDHQGPVYLYLYSLPGLLLPWAPLFIAALIGLLVVWKELDANTKWLLYASAAIFAFFTISGSRRSYYILPVVPMCCLMMAIFVMHLTHPRVQEIRRRGMQIQMILLAVIAGSELIVGGGQKIIEHYAKIAIPHELYVSMLVIGMSAAAVGVLASLRSRQIWGMVGMSVVLMGGFFGWQQGILDVFRTEHPFAMQLKPYLESLSPKQVAFYRISAAELLFDLGMNAPPAMLGNSTDFRAFIAQDGDKVVVTELQYISEVQRMWPQHLSVKPDMAEEKQPWIKELPYTHWVAWVIPADTPASAVSR